MLKVYTPSTLLSNYITCYWSLDSLTSEHTELVYPCGRIQIIFHYGKPFTERNRGVHELTQPRFSLCGQKTTYSHVKASIDSGMIGAVFKTESASSFFKLPLYEITDYSVELSDICRNWKDFSIKFTENTDDQSRIETIEEFLLNNLKDEPTLHRYFVKSCINEIRADRGLSSPYKSMDYFNLSERSMQRIFKEKVGLSPKKFAEIVRLENSIALFEEGKTMTEVCHKAGYYDQSHFIKTFRQFTGLTPVEFMNSF